MGQQQLFFSIIIPTYNRPERLATCMQSLVCLNYSRDHFEVIVVDDGSPMSLEPVVAPFQDKFDVTLIKQPNAGPATARNTGAARASGQLLVFTDDDCMPAPDWLQTLAARFATAPGCLIGGRTLNALPDNLYSTASQVLIDYLYRYYNADPNQSSFFASNNLALPADHFHTLGGFDTTFPLAAAEDREFCDRWLHHGYEMIYAPEVLVHHSHHLALPTFWRQHFNYGQGAFCFHQMRSQHTQERIKVEPLSFYLGLLIYPFSQITGWRGLLLAGLMGISQVANVAGFFGKKMQHNQQAPDQGPA